MVAFQPRILPFWKKTCRLGKLQFMGAIAPARPAVGTTPMAEKVAIVKEAGGHTDDALVGSF